MTVKHIGAQEMNPKVKPQITKFLRPLIRLSLSIECREARTPSLQKQQREPNRPRHPRHHSRQDPSYDGGSQDTCPRDKGPRSGVQAAGAWDKPC